MGYITQLDEILAAQDGIVTMAQALAAGISRSSIQGRVDRGRWQGIGRGGYLSTAHPFTDRARLRAAVAANRGTADRTAAAWWHGMLADLPPVITLTIPVTGRGATSVSRTDLRRRSLDPADIETVAGLSVTRRPLTVLESGALLPDGEGARLMDRALQTGEVTVDGLRAALDRNRGRHGLAAARRLVEVVATDSESVAERRFLALLRQERIRGWVQQFPIGRYRADFAFPDERVVVEIDGWAFHRSQRRFQADHDKLNAITVAGWLPLAFTWHDLDANPIGTIEQLVTALRSRRVRR